MKIINENDARVLGKKIAQQIVSKKISEYEGGIKIWKEIIDNLEVKCPDDFWPFKSNASAIEDIKWNAEQGGSNNDILIDQCKNEIMNAAKKLIETV